MEMFSEKFGVCVGGIPFNIEMAGERLRCHQTKCKSCALSFDASSQKEVCRIDRLHLALAVWGLGPV